MTITNVEQEVQFDLMLKIKPGNYIALKQQEIDDPTDNAVAGIYSVKLFDKNVFVICCNRFVYGKWTTLDYTKFADNAEHAEDLYKNMIEEIKKDLGR